MKIGFKMFVSGIVQGVGFRPFCYRVAKKYHLNGWVKNLEDSGVEIILEGEKNDIEKFLFELKKNPPILANINKISLKKIKTKNYKDFEIHKSENKSLKNFNESIPPADSAVCENCVEELFSEEDKRYLYPFISCTNCGPRFISIIKTPYDRENTTFKKFKLCENCNNEYKNPNDRRYHAQTIACEICGPKYFILDKEGKEVIGDSIKKAANLLDKGKILVIKGIGGMHVASKTTNDKVLKKLRKKLRRPGQPFAIMSPIEKIKTFAKISKEEEYYLRTKERPILVLEKKKKFYLSDLLSPGLHNVGVMLPYTPLHYLLFKYLKEPAIVMTSANFPGEPMITENKEALRKLNFVDFFLFHNLDIKNRCDDSVIRKISGKMTFLRRSRGFIPFPIGFSGNIKKTILALGAEENVTSCILKNKKIFLSQHLGNTEKFETTKFFESAIRNLLKITNVEKNEIDMVACDLHPEFFTRKFSESLAKKLRVPLIKVQHHYAHLASLIVDNEINCDDENVIGIVCDGVGYGSDENSWGGEIILMKDKNFERVAHLKYQKMPGADLAAKFSARMVAGIFHNEFEEKELKKLLIKHCLKGFKYGKKEIEILIKQMEKNFNISYTSSTGRILDAISSLLEICYYRSYEGEPAMKLESFAKKGKANLEFPVKIEKVDDIYILNTTKILEKVLELKEKSKKRENIAASSQKALADGLSEIAKKVSKENKISKIGFSGGVAYNDAITSTIKKNLESEGFEFLQHSRIPPGDGGICVGQALVAYLTKKYSTW